MYAIAGCWLPRGRLGVRVRAQLENEFGDESAMDAPVLLMWALPLRCLVPLRL